MSIWDSAIGKVRVELTGAQITASMEKLNNLGIELKNTEIVNSLCVRFTVSRPAFSTVRSVLEQHGDSVKLMRKEGAYWTFLSLLRRPVLLAGLLVLLCSALYIPNHIYFVQVYGNEKLSASELLSAAEQCGVYFGVTSSAIRSETVKNQLLERLPQLQWAAINTRGCVATIQIREREDQPTKQSVKEYGSIIAARDGIIEECTVYSGNLICKPGQAVKAGDVLISGLTDCGLLIKHTQAEGDILAQTKRQIHAIMPDPYGTNMLIRTIRKNFALRIGKNIINFSKDSGISDASCVKMYEEKYIELPGGFCLPIAWICQTSYDYEIGTQTKSSQLELLVDDYLKTQMIGGSIISRDYTYSIIDGATELQAQYSCLEMIGKKSDKEILFKNEQTN